PEKACSMLLFCSFANSCCAACTSGKAAQNLHLFLNLSKDFLPMITPDISKFANVTKVTTHVLQEMKLKNEKIAMLTAYDYSMARLLDKAGIDVILVGDSASNVMAGHTST